jgi:hypothetical protein
LTAASAGCLPHRLQKYQHPSENDRSRGVVDDGGTQQHPQTMDAGMPGPTPADAQAQESPRRARRHAADEPAKPTVYAVEKQTYRFTLREADVWDAMLTVLMRNYNVNIVDRQSGIVTTEWDSYFLQGAVFRNKVSIRLSKASYNAVDVTFVNNVERLRDGAQAAGAIGAVWLPADDPADEVRRLVQNMALVLNQPPPVAPPGVLAKAAGAEPNAGNY